MSSDETSYERYESLYYLLKEIIKASNERILSEEPDKLFIENVNFFVKSYLISICTYLEAYLQDIAFKCANDLNKKLKEANIPHNFIHWRIMKDIKEKELKFNNIDLSTEKKEISDNLSTNPYKTIKLFRYLGVDLTINEKFNQNKDIINTITTKRNNIIHHNDNAMDISFLDLLSYVDVFLIYMRAIDESIKTLR